MGTSAIPVIGSSRSSRRRSLRVADTWPWCPGRCPRRRSCVAGTLPCCQGRSLVVRRRYLAVVPSPLPAAPLGVRADTLPLCPARFPRCRDAAAAGEEQLCRCDRRSRPLSCDALRCDARRHRGLPCTGCADRTFFPQKRPRHFINTARAVSRARRRPRQFRKELGQTRLLHDTLLTRTACIPTATKAVDLLRLSARFGKLAPRRLFLRSHKAGLNHFYVK
jgi:hypothetical protein